MFKFSHEMYVKHVCKNIVLNIKQTEEGFKFKGLKQVYISISLKYYARLAMWADVIHYYLIFNNYVI